mmetsp:Transcript_13615/g.17738  ORF Transcript_13615/g.17738 Transcript_13615/m.17738 type:complete len:239 (+) Transcript_13615:136-852(+)|eukprot:CAMPEP_0198139164 /NCGR_PEP_ID=MMETSP1443-20131203/2512_1 /TAXON_ID=186043 /ORGANISM="Entomoneis sp., Strain CCMP2396" /LENGTH=238 /DNA_ID=CAMNT_0043801213 /DNA_START=82 /DNA_END=798 /DNA_ORIENTATION=-
MSHFGGSGGDRTRVGTKVFLNVYDLAPANEYLYPLGLGVHHSGVEIMGTEYSFASGAGIFDCPPKVAPGARFREQIEMGSYNGGQVELRRALDELRSSFGPDDYNLIRKNCNAFAYALCWKLLRKAIPGHVNRLSDIGICCSCLLPKKFLEEAPVGDPNRASGASSAAVQKPKVPSFTGSGARLGSSEMSDSSSTWNWSSNRKNSEDDLTDRREKARKAALARMEKSSTEQLQQKQTN